MVKKKKVKDKRILSLVLSIPLFICLWYIFVVGSFNFIYNLLYTVDYTDGFTLFVLPISFAVWFLIGFFVFVIANQISKGFKQLKKKKR